MIADLARVEEFEDRVVDMALEIGAAVRIWRSWPDADSTRVVRGLMLDVAPGQEATSLLIAPEGWLVPLHEIEAAENGTLAEPPYCWVKTQFGSVEGHVAVVCSGAAQAARCHNHTTDRTACAVPLRRKRHKRPPVL